ncbi:hypothetical protein JA1_000162 [Spathaspora sp. JA1]|nr:hypothetical protein JA1_000162 [Spathaspora sp. JA1]
MQRSRSWKSFKHRIDVFRKPDQPTKDQQPSLENQFDNHDVNRNQEKIQDLQQIHHKRHQQQEQDPEEVKILVKSTNIIQPSHRFLSTISLPDSENNINQLMPSNFDEFATKFLNPTQSKDESDACYGKDEDFEPLFEFEKENKNNFDFLINKKAEISQLDSYTKVMVNILKQLQEKFPNTITISNYNGVPVTKSGLGFNFGQQRLIKDQIAQYREDNINIRKQFPHEWIVWLYDKDNMKRMYSSIQTEEQLNDFINKELPSWKKTHIMKRGLVPNTAFHPHGYLVNLELRNVNTAELLVITLFILSNKIYDYETTTAISGISFTNKPKYTRVTLWFHPNPNKSYDIMGEVRKVTGILFSLIYDFETTKVRQVTLVNNDTFTTTVC